MDVDLLAGHTRSVQTKFAAWLRPTLSLGLVYLGLTLAVTWPTVLHLTSHLPGDGGDDPALAWNLWWVKYALLNRGQNPFYTDYMFHPLGLNLAFYTLTVLNAVIALPFTLNLGVVAASNLHLFFTFMVGGYGTFLLVYYILNTESCPVILPRVESGAGRRLRWLSAALAGGFYAFASSKLFYVALGQFNIASSHWLPLAILYILRTRHQPQRLKNAGLAGLFFVLQAWSELTYASFILVFVGLYWLYEGVSWKVGPSLREGRWLEGWTLPARGQVAGGLEDGKIALRASAPLHPCSRAKPPFGTAPLLHLRAAAVFALVSLLGLSPILAAMLPDLRAEGDFFVEGSGFAEAFSADLLGFVIPTMHHPLLGHLVSLTGIRAFDKGQHIYAGVVLLGLALAGLVLSYRRPALRFWLLAAAFFAWLCLGPEVMVNGRPTGLPGPFQLLQHLPFFKGNRYPSRYSVLLLLSLSVVAGFSLVQIGRWLRPDRATRWLLALLALVFLAEHLTAPLPQSDMRVPAAYGLIAADPGDFAVLDIPFAWRNGFRITGALTTSFMFGQFYQTSHQKRLLQGNTSRNPEFKFQYFTDAPVVNTLLALETGKTVPPERWDADRAIAADVLRFFNIRYIVVRPGPADNPAVTPQATIPYIETVLPVELLADEPGIKIYRVRPDTPAGVGAKPGLHIDTGQPLAPLYFGEGWGLLSPGRAIAAQRSDVRLLLPLTGGPQRLTFHVRPPDGEPPTLQVAVNGWVSPARPAGATGQDVTFDLPAEAIHPGLNDLHLFFNRVTALSLPGPAAPLQDVTVLSAGQEVGDFGYIFVNGHQVSANQRGYNVALIAPDGATIRTASFDTHLDPTASAGLVDFITATPPGTPVAIAAADEASASLNEVAVAALQTLGVRGDLRGCFRCSHAFIRPAAGAPLEAVEAFRPAGLTTALGLTEPGLAAIVEWIQVEPVEQ